MTVTVKHSKTNAISDWTQAQLNEQIALGNFAPGTTLANIVLPSDWNNNHTLTGLGTMAEQNANSVAITGGSVNGTTIGATTATTGAFTTLTASTSLTTPTVQATNSGGLSLKNSAGTTQMSMGAGGGDNISLNVSTNLNGSNAQIDISPTGTGHVHINPTGSGSIQVNPTSVGTIDNMTIGATTASTGKFTSVTTPSVTATTTDLTLSAISTGAVNLNTAGSTLFKVIDGSPSPVAGELRMTGATSGLGRIRFGTEKALWFSTSDHYSFRTAGGTTSEGLEQFKIVSTASAVNYVQVTGAATGGQPAISVQGSDAVVSMYVATKSTGAIRFSSNGVTNTQLRIDGTVASVNSYNVFGSTAGNAVLLGAQGNDTNISTAIQPKGTGAIDLAAGSSGVNISNGGTVTAITRTALGTSYTSPPTVNISAPTTAGGVQATATVPLQQISPLTLVSGGTGYTVGDTLTISGGTFTVRPTMTVATVSGGVITSITQVNFGVGTVIPSNPMSVTGGTGSGATFSTTAWGISAVFTITNAGSGYIEQPTITFSGGGGSGAAAYATVGSATIFRSLAGAGNSAQSLSFHSSSGETLRLATSTTGLTSANYLQIASGATGNSPRLTSVGSDTDIFMGLVTKGTGAFQFLTNNGTEQLRITHTASAVNRIEVTGSTTANIPLISTAGSDASVGMELRLKGTPTGPGFRVTNNNGANVCFAVTTSAATPANYMRADPAAASASPAMSAQGSDTNIDLTLTPKGTGLVRFGTYVAGALLATGYINIKAADGTTYKVLVST